MDDLALRHIHGDALQIPIRCLPQSCRDFLSNVLDPESTLGRSDYRTFGELFGLSHFQTQGCRARNRDRSITGVLLTEFGHEPIWKLITILLQMEVAGVREILTSWQEIRRNYETEQRMLAGGYRGGVQNTESHCSCVNCAVFPSLQNPSIRRYPHFPHQPQDEGCHRGQPCQSCMPHPQQAWQPQIPPIQLKGVEGQVGQGANMPHPQQAWQPQSPPIQPKGVEGQVGQGARMVEAPITGSTRTFELTQKGPDRISERQFVANIDQDEPCGRDRRQGSLQRLMSDEDNCSYGIDSGEVEPGDVDNTLDSGVGDGTKVQNNGVGDEDSTENNGPGDGTRVKNFGVDDETRVQNSGIGDGNRIHNSGPGDEDNTLNNGPGDGKRVQKNAVGDRNSTLNNGPGDGTRLKKNGVGDGNRLQDNGVDDKRDAKVLQNQHIHDGQQEFCLTKNGHGNSPITMSDLRLDDKSELDNKDWLAPADWDSFCMSGRDIQDKASNASSQSPMAQKITKKDCSSTLQMANHNNNGKRFQLNPVPSDKSPSPKFTNYCSTYPNSIPTDCYAHSFPPYAYSEYGYPNNEAHPLHQTMQKGYMYHHNGPPQTNHGSPQHYLRTPQHIQGFPQTLQGSPQNFPGTPTVRCFPQTVLRANVNVQCFPRNIEGGHLKMVSQVPHHNTTRQGPPLHGRGSQPTQQGMDARNWVPHTSEVTSSKRTVPVASDHNQYPHGVPATAAGRVPSGHTTNPSDRPPEAEDGMVFSDKGQVQLRGQESREAAEKRHSDSDVVEEVSPAHQHRRSGSDEWGAACARETGNEHREREKYVFITGGDDSRQDAVAKEITKICYELRKLGITVVADMPDKFQAVPRDPLQGRNSISFRRDNVHEARMAYFERATCVLMIVSPGYKAYVDKDNDQAQAQPTEHQSATRHIYTLMLTEYCEKNFSKNKRFYPVCLTKLNTKRSDIPDWISSTLTYCFPSKELFKHLKQDLEND